MTHMGAMLASIGLAMFPDDAFQPEDLARRADIGNVLSEVPRKIAGGVV